MQELYVWDIVLQAAVILVALFGGGRTVVEVVSRLKSLLGTHGVWTQLLAAVVSLVLGLATLIAEGSLTPEAIRVDNFSVWFLMVFAASQAIYRRLVDEGVIKQPS